MEICIENLFKRCDCDYFYHKPNDFNLPMFCLIDEFLSAVCNTGFWSCNCPN